MEIDFNNLRENIASNYNSLVEGHIDNSLPGIKLSSLKWFDNEASGK